MRIFLLFVHLFNTLNTAPHRTCKRACTVQPVHVHKNRTNLCRCVQFKPYTDAHLSLNKNPTKIPQNPKTIDFMMISKLLFKPENAVFMHVCKGFENQGKRMKTVFVELVTPTIASVLTELEMFCMTLVFYL